MTVEAETADQLLARKKVEALARERYRPVLRATKLNVVTVATGIVAGVVVALVTRQVGWAAETTTLIASLVGSSPGPGSEMPVTAGQRAR